MNYDVIYVNMWSQSSYCFSSYFKKAEHKRIQHLPQQCGHIKQQVCQSPLRALHRLFCAV